MAEMDPATVLEEAADLLLIRGHCKHIQENERGEHCLLGAVLAVGDQVYSDAAWTEGPTRSALVAVAGVLGVEVGSGYGIASPLTSWNNAPERDADEVIDVLRLAAKDLRNGAKS